MPYDEFDADLERALSTLTSRLHDDVSRHVRSVGAELAAAAARIVPPPPEPLPEPPPEREPPSIVEGVRAIGEARSLTDILGSLVTQVARHAARARVVLVRGDGFKTFRSQNFDALISARELDDGEALDIAGPDAGVIAHAANTAATASGGHTVAPAFAGLAAGQSCVAVPLIIANEVVAVLYADTAINGAAEHPQPENPEPAKLEPGTLNLEPIEILTLHASRCLEALTAATAARSLMPRPAAASPQDPARHGEPDGGNERAGASLLESKT
jgi:hypothetical protein